MNITTLLSSNYEVYFTVDDEKMFKLDSDGNPCEVSTIPIIDRKVPIIVLHKHQFDLVKNYYLNPENSDRISFTKAEFYNRIGFISDEELEQYSIHLKSSPSVSEQV